MLAKLVILNHFDPLGILSSGSHSHAKRVRKLQNDTITLRDAENSKFQRVEKSHFSQQERRARDKQECSTLNNA